jgi:hypothetical protein
MPYQNKQIQLLQLIRLLRMAWYLSETIRNTEEALELEVILSTAGTLLIFAFLVDALSKQINLAQRPQQSIQDEIKLTRTKPAFFSNTNTLESKLFYVRLIKNKPLQWRYLYCHNKGEHYSILIDTTNDTLGQHIGHMHILSLKLSQQLAASKKNNFKSLKLAEVPKLYGYTGPFSINRALHASVGCDMPSKRRVWELSLALRDFIVYFKNIITLGNPNFPMEAFIVSMLALREGYLLNQQNTHLAYTGIQRRLTPYEDFPPTCLGQQLTAQHLFVGDNEILYKHIEFLIHMMKYIEHLEWCMNAWRKDLSDISVLNACIDTKREVMSLVQILHNTPINQSFTAMPVAKG